MSTNSSRLLVKVQPNAGRNEVVGLYDGVWKLKIAAPPDKGKANKELIEFLSVKLAVRKDSIAILKGETSHHKVLSVEGMSLIEAVAALSSSLK
jgi:uncharacterized protein